MIDWWEAFYAGLGGAAIGGCVQCAIYAKKFFISRKPSHALAIATLGVCLAGAIVLTAPLLKKLHAESRARKFEQGAYEVPLFRLILEHNPDVKAKLKEEAARLQSGEIDEVEGIRNVATASMGAYTAYVAVTSDKAISDYIKASLEAAHVLEEKNAQLCSDIINSGSFAAAHELDKARKTKVLNAMTEIVGDALTSPQDDVSVTSAVQALEPVLEGFGAAGNPGKIFALMHDRDPETACATFEEFYSRVLLLPTHDAGLGGRAILSGRLSASLLHGSTPIPTSGSANRRD